MAKPGLQPVTVNDTFQGWLNRTNEMVSLFQTDAITASVIGDTTGTTLNPVSATLIGTFSANNIIVNDLIRVNNISPRIGFNTITIEAQITANTSLQTAAVFKSSQGARTTYASSSSSWFVGYENVSTSNFIIDNGVGNIKFRLTTAGNLTLSGNLTAQTVTATQFNGTLVGNVTGNLTGNVNGNISGNVNGNAATASRWLSAINVTIGNTQKQIRGDSNVSWSISEIGAVPSTRQISTSNGLTGGGDLSSNRTISLSGQALSFHNLNTNGIVVRSGTNSVKTVQISGTTNQITVTNGDGINGNPTISAVIATKNESEVGTNNIKLMTPLRVHEAIDFLRPKKAILKDIKNPGVSGQIGIGGQWVVRHLNTIEYNEIPGLILNSNQITLPAGTYEFHITCPAFNTSSHKGRLRVVDGPTLILGSSALSNAGDPSTTESIIRGIVVLSEQTNLVIEHITWNSGSNRPLGWPSSFPGVNEVYTICSIEKIK
jgi:hypothetical protein